MSNGKVVNTMNYHYSKSVHQSMMIFLGALSSSKSNKVIQYVCTHAHTQVPIFKASEYYLDLHKCINAKYLGLPLNMLGKC